MRSAAAIAIVAVLALSGCSTLTNNQTQGLGIETVPSGAICAVDTFRTVTPGIIVLSRGGGSRKVICKLDGYEPGVGVFKDEYNGFLPEVVSNLIFGVIPGMIIDSASGADSSFSPIVLVVKMKPLLTAPAGAP